MQHPVNAVWLSVKHGQTWSNCWCCCPAGEPLHVDLLELGQFLVLTMADFAEQLFSWQDCIFGNTDGALRLEGAPDPEPRYLW